MTKEEIYSRAGYKTAKQDAPNYVTSYCMCTYTCIHRKKPTSKDKYMVIAVNSGSGNQSDWCLFCVVFKLSAVNTYCFRI